ncbi:MAG: 50S ribosomal protein L10 [Candidatus Zixiibacteriota bacterium]
MLRPQKEEVVDKLKEKLKQSKSLYITDFTGLNVDQINQLRRDFKKQGAEFVVTKNSLWKLAVRDLGLDPLLNYLEGPTGIVFGYEDPFVPAKILYDFNKKTDKPKTKAFWVEENLFQGEKLEELARLPSREGLLTQIVGSINSPITNLVCTLDGVLRNFIGTIEAIIKAKSS